MLIPKVGKPGTGGYLRERGIDIPVTKKNAPPLGGPIITRYVGGTVTGIRTVLKTQPPNGL